jgi:hypothetical protein
MSYFRPKFLVKKYLFGANRNNFLMILGIHRINSRIS